MHYVQIKVNCPRCKRGKVKKKGIKRNSHCSAVVKILAVMIVEINFALSSNTEGLFQEENSRDYHAGEWHFIYMKHNESQHVNSGIDLNNFDCRLHRPPVGSQFSPLLDKQQTFLNTFTKFIFMNAIIETIKQEKAVAIIRLPDSHHTLPVFEAIYHGGLRAIEVTVTTPGAIDSIKALAKGKYKGLCLGAGSVVDTETVRQCADAGAQYIVTPALNDEVVEEALRLGLPVLAGALTPSEILRAHRLGCSLVKLFPADLFGPRYVKAIRAPMPYIDLVPTGGVSIDNVAEWLGQGASAVGISSALFRGFDATKANYEQIQENSAAFHRAIHD